MNKLQWMNKTHFFIKIYLSHFILERATQFVVSLRDRLRDIYSERGLLLALYLLPGARGCQYLHPPLASRIVRDNLTPVIGCVSLAQLSILTGLCLNLTTWFSYHMVSFQLYTYSTSLPRHTAIPLFTNQNVIACQSTWGHQEWTQNPCQQSLYNKPTIVDML